MEIGGGVTCSNFTVKNSIFSAGPGQDSPCIRLSGEGKTLELKRLMFDQVVFEGFSKGLMVDGDVMTREPVKILNSDFAGAKHQLDIPAGMVKIEGTDPA